jgi:hypothetical protein
MDKITHINSTEILRFMARNNYHLLYEKGAPYTDLKRDFISVRGPNGESGFSTPEGFKSNIFELPRAIFDDFIAASFIAQDGQEDNQHRLIFRLTADGRATGLGKPRLPVS